MIGAFIGGGTVFVCYILFILFFHPLGPRLASKLCDCFIYGLAPYIFPSIFTNMYVERIKRLLKRYIFIYHDYIYVSFIVAINELPTQFVYGHEIPHDPITRYSREYIREFEKNMGHFIDESVDDLRWRGVDKVIMKAEFGHAPTYLQVRLDPLWENIFKNALIASADFTPHEKEVIHRYRCKRDYLCMEDGDRYRL